MIDLKKIYNEHKEYFNNCEKFKACLMDLYPDEKKAKINILGNMLEEGAISVAQNESESNDEMFCNRICEDYGYNLNIVKECLALFTDIFRKTVAMKYSEKLPPDYPTLEDYDRTKFEIVGTVLTKYKGKDSDVKIPFGVESIGFMAFVGCESLTSVTIPYGVDSICMSAFRLCRSLTSITIPDSVTKIGGNAFKSCSSLTSLTIPNGVTVINDNTFEDCSSLTSIIIPDSVTVIGASAFSGCDSLMSIIIPRGINYIGYNAFVAHKLGCMIYFNGTKWQWMAIKGYSNIKGVVCFLDGSMYRY